MGEAMLPLPLSLGEGLPGTERGRPVAFLRPPDPTLPFNLPARVLVRTAHCACAWLGLTKGGVGVSCSDFEADSEGNLWRAHLVLPAEPPFAFAQNPTEGVPETPPGASHAGRGSRFGEQQGYREPD